MHEAHNLILLTVLTSSVVKLAIPTKIVKIKIEEFVTLLCSNS